MAQLRISELYALMQMLPALQLHLSQGVWSPPVTSMAKDLAPLPQHFPLCASPRTRLLKLLLLLSNTSLPDLELERIHVELPQGISTLPCRAIEALEPGFGTRLRWDTGEQAPIYFFIAIIVSA